MFVIKVIGILGNPSNNGYFKSVSRGKCGIVKGISHATTMRESTASGILADKDYYLKMWGASKMIMVKV